MLEEISPKQSARGVPPKAASASEAQIQFSPAQHPTPLTCKIDTKDE